MNDYRKVLTDKLEKSGLDFINGFTNIKVSRNNLTTITAPDYVKEDGRYIDFQFSADFGKYGDFRVDLISAFLIKEAKTPEELDNISREKLQKLKSKDISSEKDIFEFIKSEFENISKKGKYFTEEKLDQIIFFIYNSKTPNFDRKPDKIFILEKTDVLEYLNKEIKNLRRALKVNIKKDINDMHGSMFIPINLKSFIIKNEYKSYQYKTKQLEEVEIIIKNEDMLSEKAKRILIDKIVKENENNLKGQNNEKQIWNQPKR